MSNQITVHYVNLESGWKCISVRALMNSNAMESQAKQYSPLFRELSDNKKWRELTIDLYQL